MEEIDAERVLRWRGLIEKLSKIVILLTLPGKHLVHLLNLKVRK